ncbi:MAG: nucleotidyltransferase family protein [Capsulimonadales bacterium]|nr:nucleotidyltransferase family protein [Capsulimonadales bacterium]
MSDPLPILVLAGGGMPAEMRAVAPEISCRALLPLNGRPMLDYVLPALVEGRRLSGNFGRLLVAGRDLPLPKNAVPVPDGDSMVDTLLTGVSALFPEETRLLVSTADVPLLTPEAVADLIDRAEHFRDVDFLYPIVDAYSCEAAFPGMRRTTLQIAEGEFTGGNLVLINPEFLKRNESALREAYAQRKNIPGLARMLGFGAVSRLVLSRVMPRVLSLSYLEHAVGRLLGGATACAVVVPYPEIGADVDRPEDIPVAEELLRRYGDGPLPPASMGNGAIP